MFVLATAVAGVPIEAVAGVPIEDRSNNVLLLVMRCIQDLGSHIFNRNTQYC